MKTLGQFPLLLKQVGITCFVACREQPSCLIIGRRQLRSITLYVLRHIVQSLQLQYEHG